MLEHESGDSSKKRCLDGVDGVGGCDIIDLTRIHDGRYRAVCGHCRAKHTHIFMIARKRAIGSILDRHGLVDVVFLVADYDVPCPDDLFGELRNIKSATAYNSCDIVPDNDRIEAWGYDPALVRIACIRLFHVFSCFSC